LRRFTQRDVAHHLDTNSFTVSRWERGVSFPNMHYRERLCRLFGKSAEELGLAFHSGFEIENSIDTFPSLLRQERVSRGWSRWKLASLIECDEQAVSRWERGETVPNKFFRERLCRVFDKSIEAFKISQKLYAQKSSPLLHSIGGKLKLARRQHRLTQEKLAEAIGVSSRTITRWESDTVCPELIYQQALCEFFRMDAEELGFVEVQTELIGADETLQVDRTMLPNQLTRLRRLRGWTQRDVAKKLGTYPMNISRWEHGEAAPDALLGQKLSDLFEKTLDELGIVTE